MFLLPKFLGPGRTVFHPITLRSISRSSTFLKDYYKILGVPQNSNGKDIKKAYYQLAKKFHPDTNKGDPTAETKFQEVSEAYEVLSDDTRRADFDAFSSSGGSSDQFSSQHRQQRQAHSNRGRAPGGVQWEYKSNVDPEELFKTIFGEFTRRGGAGGGPRGFQNPFDDIFSNFNFQGGVQAECHVSFIEAAKGASKEIEVLEADNFGRLVGKRKLGVPVPAGISDGQTLRMSLGQRREVFVTVRVEESDYFRREGNNIHTTANISISQALLGGIIRLKGLYEDLNLRIPAGTSSHAEMTLTGRGIKNMERYNSYGDHIVHIIIKLPVTLTEEQKDLIREYAYLEKNTPGTVNGVDRSSFSWAGGRSKEKARETTNDQRETTNDQTETNKSSENIKAESSTAPGNDTQGTLQKISDAILNNETVLRIKKAIFG